MYYVILILLVIYRFIIKTISSAVSLLDTGRLTYDIEDEKINKRVESYISDSDFYLSAASLISVIILIFSGILTYSKLFGLYHIRENIFFVSYDGVNTMLSVWGYLGFFVVLIVLSFIFSFIGGAIPRNIAIKNPVWYISQFGIILKISAYLLFPLVKPLSFFSVRLSRIELDPEDFNVEENTEDEISQLLSAGEETGTIDENEREMIENIFSFDDTTAEDIFTHRRDIVALPVTCTLEDIRKIILFEKYTRIPVYENNIDNIIGILHIKDFAKYYIKTTRTKLNVRRLLKPTFYVPTNKKVGEIFEEMQKTKIHLAVVVDEYGGTLGIVTMEDIVEEVMGDIFDEYDVNERPEIVKNDDGSFSIDGSLSLEDVADELETEDFPDEDIDTIGGYMVAKVGYIPDNDKISEFSFTHDGWEFKAERIENKRIVFINAVKILSKSDDRAVSGEESPDSAEQNAG